MEDLIRQTLLDVEKSHDVKIILACESGSRAWGFPSQDSDYDVRFIYVHDTDWYLSIAHKPDVIELPIDDQLDINGWDLKKSLQLLRKSNVPLLEWLASPIVYMRWNDTLEPLIRLSKKAFLPESACHHYLAMARNKVNQFQEADKIKAKTYMDALRAVLCCDWITRFGDQPPLPIDDLIKKLIGNTKLSEYIRRIISEKKSAVESDAIPRSDLLESYIINQLSGLDEKIPKNPAKTRSEEFDLVFRQILGNTEAEKKITGLKFNY